MASSNSNFRGYIQIYTGDGKGKTTAALGLALRAAGHGMRVYVGQFLKGRGSGEIPAAEKLSPLVTIEQFGRKGFIQVTDGAGEEDIQRAQEGLRKCRQAMLSKQYAVVVLDEVLVAVHFKIVSEKDILEFLDQKPSDVEIILTGRYASPGLIRKADLVTEMMDRKHYAGLGVKARDGIEK